MTRRPEQETAAVRRALFIGRDWVLFQEVESALRTTYALSMEHEAPKLWPQDLDAVLIQAGPDPQATLEQIRRVTGHGLKSFLLLSEPDIDLVLQASRLGIHAFAEVPDEIPQLASIMHMASRRHQGRGGVVSVFFSLKGGVGTTTLAVNGAGHLAALTGARTALVDLNMPLGDVALYLDRDETYAVSDFIYNMGRFDEKLIYDSLTRHDSGVYLMGLPKRFEDLEQLTPEAVKAMLASLRRYFDHVVVDCASDLSAITLACLDDADNLMLVAEPTLAALRAAQSVYELTRRLGYDRGKVRMVVNRDSAMGKEIADELLESMEVPVCARVANSYRDFLAAVNEGRPVQAVAPESLAARQIRALAEMLHHGAERAEPVSDRRRRFRLRRHASQ